MKNELREKLSMIFEKCRDEDIEKILRWQQAKNNVVTDGEKEALRAGYSEGWRAAINMINLHF